MTTMSKAALLAKAQRRYTEVAIGDGETVRLQSITELEHSKLEASRYRRVKLGDKTTIELNDEALEQQPARLLALFVVDEAGERIFSDWKEAGQLDASISNVLYDDARKHCGLDKAENPEKNLPQTTGSDSPTVSP
jgi:hypothetical protein